MVEQNKGASSLASRLEGLIAPEVRALGYELLDLEYQGKSAMGAPLLRLFIDHLDSNPSDPEGKKIQLDDCAKVDKGLDPFFESETFANVLPKGFTLEVSSPGIDRPLKHLTDFERFKALNAQVKTFRPVTLEELGNAKYFEHHQKQKNFIGTIVGVEGDRVVLESDRQRITIPFGLIAKAHLDIASQIPLSE